MFEDTENLTRSALHFSYEGCLQWRNADELRAELLRVTPALLRTQAQDARADYERRHTMQYLGMCATIPDTYVAPTAWNAGS
ncbi:MAG: hypothetical protein EBR27_11715 [Betaproteobacteria bacterium]|nr:hypothetical protein [Betaproteobacteria bacterium]